MIDLDRIKQLAGLSQEPVNEEETHVVASGHVGGRHEVHIVQMGRDGSYMINADSKLAKMIGDTHQRFGSFDDALYHVEIGVESNGQEVNWTAGVDEIPEAQDEEQIDREAFDASETAARQAHHWVQHDADPNQMKAAVWGLFMEFEPEELAKLHQQFKAEEAAERGDM